MQIQTTNYSLYDVIRMKKKEFIMILLSFTPSDMIFEPILMPTVILAILSQKSYSYLTFLT